MRNIKILFANLLYFILISLLSSCSGFFDKDNTPPPFPLVKFTPEAKIQTIWRKNTGEGVGTEYLKLIPAVTEQTIFTASKNGTVYATDRLTGKNIWQANTHTQISAGPTAAEGLVLVGSREGNVIALYTLNGKQAWRTNVSSEILAAPAISDGIVVVKSIDGRLTAFSAQDGKMLWAYNESEPLLILRGASVPQISHGNVIVGFANGNLTRISLHEGSQYWHQPIATAEGSFAIQRMIDIDADPIIFNNHVYAATYQGRIASLDITTGRQYWSHDISSYIGMAADSDKIYISDAKSHIWAFEASTGNVFWRQKQLEFRNISGPAIIDNYIVVGDEEGYLHLLNKQDGHFVARVRVDSSGILAAPVVFNHIIYVFTKDGQLAAYRLG